jgi:hypothetical protein
MKSILPTAVLASALAACATPYAPPEFDFSEFAGTVESAHAAPRDLHAFDEAVEHQINPRLAQRLLIRLDDGRALVVRIGEQQYTPGERVRIVAGQVERE